jgi:phospholipid/cholesterol/gamma-HCH transport system substrate-binding protein
METDKRYFTAGLFIIVLSIGAALAFIWLAGSERRDDVTYRIRFAESVAGLSLGESVKYRGVDVGTVEDMKLSDDDPRVVEVDVSLRKETPVKTDTRASLRLKGITGALFIELNGGEPGSQPLLAVTSSGEPPEIVSEKSPFATAIDRLPVVIDKFASLENQMGVILKNVNTFTEKVKENPSLLLRRPKRGQTPPSTQASDERAGAGSGGT